MRTLVWGLTALFAAGWTGTVWLTHQITAWLLGALNGGTLQEAGGAVARLPLPPLPEGIVPWVDTAWLHGLQAWGAALLDWMHHVLPGGDALMAWVGPLLWIGWGLGLAGLLALAVPLHVLVGRGPSIHAAVTGFRSGRA